MSVYNELEKRGFIAQSSHLDELKKALQDEKLCFYTGFDATSDSLTAGHMIPVMAMAHLQKAGHIPIVLIGGGTTLIGDPSDRTEMRSLMSREKIEHNVKCFEKQLRSFLDFGENIGYMRNNADWLLDLNYLEFIRDIGIHFSVNKMLTAECYKNRMEKGLSFFEFNYMIMQAYDFLHLNNTLNCSLQVGGNDQWSNMLAGADLIRRRTQNKAYALTLELLTLPSGEKMGKTAKGAIFLDPKKTSPYDFFQYFRNVADSDVISLLKRLTFISLDEIAKYEKLEGSELNKVKEILAYDLTSRVHGNQEADKARKAASEIFKGSGVSEDMPSFDLDKSRLDNELELTELLVEMDIIKSKGEGRRLIKQNGISLNSKKLSDGFYKLSLDDFKDNEAIVQKGRKVFYKIILK